MPTAPTTQQVREQVVIRFAGNSGDGMQLTGDRFTQDTAIAGNGIATLPSFPAEIRAPQGTLAGVSSFQIHFADHKVSTPGDAPDVLVAMNPAALKANIDSLQRGATVIADSDEFTTRNLAKVGYTTNPLQDGTLTGWKVHQVPLTSLTVQALADHGGLTRKERERSRNMFALGMLTWMFSRENTSTADYLRARLADRPELLKANLTALAAGWSFGETTEEFISTYVPAAPALPGTYRNITGNTALALGLAAAAHRAGLRLVLGSYPITPASDILHTLSGLKELGVVTIQAEDEIAAIGVALGASYGGGLGATATSGPGVALKSETIGLAVSLELPLVIVDVQRGGPSTGLPTKTEQSDLLQAMFGRNGESPVPIVAASTPSDCFDAAIEAARIATTYRTPVFLLSDGHIANGAEPWVIPQIDDLPDLRVEFASRPNGHVEGREVFHPYLRDAITLARPWAIPGTPGLEHRIGGIEKADVTGEISYEPANHDTMTRLRQRKIDQIDSPDLEVDDPQAGTKVLLLGWGSTYGANLAAVRQLRRDGHAIALAHLRQLNPFPRNLAGVLRRYERVIVPEMNLGQLALLLRARYLVDIRSHTAVTGLPFTTSEIVQLAMTHLNEAP